MEKYNDRTGKLEFSANPNEIELLAAYLSWLKHKEEPLFAFDAFKAGAEYARQPYGWISVKDRLPEEIHDMVFCCRRDGSIMFVDLREGLLDSFPDIEYWMPYPLPPMELQKPVRIISDKCEIEAMYERLVAYKKKNGENNIE